MPLVFKGLRGVSHIPVDCEKKRCTARDFNGLAMTFRLYIAAAGKLTEHVIAPRIRKIPSAWRCWRAGTALIGRALDTVMQTVPDDQFERLATIMEHGVLDINLPRVRINEEGGSILAVQGQALERLTYYAMRNECAICMKEGREAKRCDLYGALKGVIEPETWESYGCPWRDEIMRRLEEERREKK